MGRLDRDGGSGGRARGRRTGWRPQGARRRSAATSTYCPARPESSVCTSGARLRSTRGTGEGSGPATSAEPLGPVHPAEPPVTAPYEVIHLGGEAAVIVPLTEFLRLRALESTASAQALEDAEAAQDWLAREARAETTYVPLPEVRRRLGLAD
jgi:hypothetical protein